MNAQEYWNHKILGWESARYSWRSFFNPGSWSVRNRLFTSLDFLRAICLSSPESRILEIGCGSGELAQNLRKYSLINYLGWDISEVAIQKAEERFQGTHFKFKVQNLETAPELPKADYTVLLGVTDWISENAFGILLKKINSENILISYTENKKGLRNHLYQLYRQRADQQAHQTTTYTESAFRNAFQAHGWKLEKDLSKRAMSPGRLLWLKKNTSI